ncbi:hypothetical protein H0H93_010807 [Arthromyces matolae]|nr:hypothetical protein H0H93_010807 [Arthromyces matolae]
MSAQSSHSIIATEWLNTFAHALTSANIEDVTSTFLPEGWLRDVLTFTWNSRSLAGHEKVAAYLKDTLSVAKVANVKLEEECPALTPQPSAMNPDWIASGFTFTTQIAIGQGYFHLARDVDQSWKAQIVFMSVKDLKGHEESGVPEQGIYDGPSRAWIDVLQEKRLKIEENPHVIIVGAGQTGLHIAARFRQMNISSLVVEANSRIGDNWRKRYPTLRLHTPRSHHSPTGVLGSPHYPELIDRDAFEGVTMHACNYRGGRPFSGKRVVVVGAGNTSADICQDLVIQGAQSVTMVQRSSTCVLSPKSVELTVTRSWPESVSPEISDFKFMACPLLFFRDHVRQFEKEAWDRDKDLHEGLVKSGLKLNMGTDGSGLASLLYKERVGGNSGKIQVKQGIEPDSFTKNALVFRDGSALPADVVIFA